MSSIRSLTEDLQTLSSESKRKSPEVRQSTETALTQLKGFPPPSSIKELVTNESVQINIIEAYILACRSGNVKLATISVGMLNRLINMGIVPPKSLGTLLEALKEATNLAIDIQLKILQCLPSLSQNYEEYMSGDLLLLMLSICSSLTANNKSTVVINTASATLQQLFGNIFDKLKNSSPDAPKNNPLTIDNEETINLDDISLESFNIFHDLTRLLENENTPYFKGLISIRTTSVLEIIENVLASHVQVFRAHSELAYLLRVKVVPALLRILYSPSRSFALIVRSMRVIQVLLLTQLDILEVESELISSFLNHILVDAPDKSHDKAMEAEKIVVLEVFRNLFNHFDVIKLMFEKFDLNPKKKDVFKELLTIFHNYVEHNATFTTDIVLPPTTKPPQQSTTPILSKSISSIKNLMLDHLDKTDAPSSFPSTYPMYLIFNILLSYSEGTAKFVQKLSSDSLVDSIESDVEFINVFFETGFPDISALYEKFLYLRMDGECFHYLIRSLQKFTHTTGLLGLSSLRDNLLTMLSKATINNTSLAQQPAPAAPNSGGSTIQEQGMQLLAFGESLVETFSSSKPSQSTDTLVTTHSQSQTPKLPSRYYNSRHVICLRALINLAISLGSTLQGSWVIIWRTFQWADYYIHGPDEFSVSLNDKKLKSLNESMLPKLSSQDLSNIESSEKKFTESINDYPKESLYHLLSSLSDLSEESLSSLENGNEPPTLESSDDKYSKLCPYNRVYFLSKLLQISEVNLLRNLIEQDEPWMLVSDYFIRAGTRRTLSYGLRIHVVTAYKQLVSDLATIGFENSSEITRDQTSKKSLAALIGFLNKMFESGPPSELITLNCETEIHLILLKTLHDLIDKYDTYYQNSWNIVFQILNTPFRAVLSKTGDNNLREKVRFLIESSFDTLKLILDEFLLTLPMGQLKLLIDTLFNFCSQTSDLNISFSSVSYFWLFSDSLKSRISSAEDRSDEDKSIEIKTESDLVYFIEKNKKGSKVFFFLALDTYLLSTLLKLSSDSRAQVREGSIQTFFQIIDVHGSILTPFWNLIYDVVLPRLLNLELEINDPEFNRREWIETLTLILSGLVSLYGKFIMNFSNVIYPKWEGLLNYFKRLLDLKWVDLNLKIFKAFNDLLKPFSLIDVTIKNPNVKKIRNKLFQFWCEIPIEYDFTSSLYQDSITSLMECFPPLYNIIKSEWTTEEITTVIGILNKCARYPVLPDKTSDAERPSKLQAAVLKNLEIIDEKDTRSQSLVAQQLNSIATYPFGVRQRIEQKLTKVLQNRIQVPTFIAVSHLSLKLLSKRLRDINNLKELIDDKGIYKILKSMIEIIRTKSQGITREAEPFWVEGSNIFQRLVSQLIEKNREELKEGDELWSLILVGMKMSFETQNLIAEDINITQYSSLRDVVLPALLGPGEPSRTSISDLIASIYTNSFLYDFDSLEVSLLAESGEDPYQITTNFTEFDFGSYFGSTKPIAPFANIKTRLLCLEELIKFCMQPENYSLNEVSILYFTARSAVSLRRFISDSMLLFRCPAPKIQQQELLIILDGLYRVQKSLERDETKSPFIKLQPLLTKLIPYASKMPELHALLEPLIDSFYGI